MTTHSKEAGELYHAHWSPEYQTWVRRMAERQRRAVIGESEPTYTLDRDIIEARERMGTRRWNELNAEWMK